jgi:hypothetical protein
MSTENKFYELSEDTLELIQGLVSKMALPFNLRIKYMGNSKQKQLVKLQKVSDVFSHITNIDLLMFVNEDYYIRLEEKNAEILIYQELDRLQFDIEKGTFKIAKFLLQTNPGVLKKYGIDAVAEANQLSDLYTQQKADGADSEFDASATEIKKVKKSVEFLN